MTKPALYPLKFTPILKSTIWGGKKLNALLGKPSLGDDPVGESWEISGVENNISIVANGALEGESLTKLIKKYKGELLGQKVYEEFAVEFPLLIKFIDAKQDLSIQVHPDDKLAKARHNSFGKTEMWYVVDAEAGATLISGFNKATSKEEYLEYFNSGKLLELLNSETVAKDDVYFLPAGRVHTIGKGLLIAEIQQTSDITYRIYDFNRVDKDGNRRQLHVNEALEAIDYNYYDDYKTTFNKDKEEAQLVSCAYFTTNRLLLNYTTTRNYKHLDSFVVLMFLEGRGSILAGGVSVPFSVGDTYLIPASCETLSINPDQSAKILEVYLP